MSQNTQNNVKPEANHRHIKTTRLGMTIDKQQRTLFLRKVVPWVQSHPPAYTARCFGSNLPVVQNTDLQIECPDVFAASIQ